MNINQRPLSPPSAPLYSLPAQPYSLNPIRPARAPIVEQVARPLITRDKSWQIYRTDHPELACSRKTRPRKIQILAIRKERARKREEVNFGWGGQVNWYMSKTLPGSTVTVPFYLDCTQPKIHFHYQYIICHSNEHCNQNIIIIIMRLVYQKCNQCTACCLIAD